MAWRGKKSGKRRIQKNQPELVCLVLLSMVRKERLELSRLGRQNLNLVRLTNFATSARIMVAMTGFEPVTPHYECDALTN